MDKNQNTLTNCHLENVYMQQLCNGIEQIAVNQTDQCGSSTGPDYITYCDNDDFKGTMSHQHYQLDFQNSSNNLDVEISVVSIEAIKNQKAMMLRTDSPSGSTIFKREILQETKQESVREHINVKVATNDSCYVNLDYRCGQENQNRNRSYQSYSNLINMYCCKCKVVLRNVTNCRCEACQSALKFQCIKCSGLYKKHIAVLNHIKHECYKLSKFRCNFCTYTTFGKFSILKHLQKKHPVSDKSDYPYQCYDCRKKFKKRQFLLRHKTSCDKRRFVVCHYCSYRCTSKAFLAQHIKEKHGHYQYK